MRIIAEPGLSVALMDEEKSSKFQVPTPSGRTPTYHAHFFIPPYTGNIYKSVVFGMNESVWAFKPDILNINARKEFR